MPLLTNLGNRIVGYSFVSRPRSIKWNAFGSGASWHSDWINFPYAVCDVYRQTPYQQSFFITYGIYISKHAFFITILQNIMCKCAKTFFPDPLPGIFSWTPLGEFRHRTSSLVCVYSRPLWGNLLPKNSRTLHEKNRRDRRTRGTKSWLDDTDKTVYPNLPLLFKLRELCSVDSQENH